jgi:hypothetical protein
MDALHKLANLDLKNMAEKNRFISAAIMIVTQSILRSFSILPSWAIYALTIKRMC